jgi:hypothetical protein
VFAWAGDRTGVWRDGVQAAAPADERAVLAYAARDAGALAPARTSASVAMTARAPRCGLCIVIA